MQPPPLPDFPDHGDDRYFTLEGYRAILRRAKALGYRIATFREFVEPTDDAPVLLLRHDLDHDLESAAIFGRLEAEEGVAATYFVQPACPFYNLLSERSRAIVRGLADEGHEVGLHYYAAHYVDKDEGEARLKVDLELVAGLSGFQVHSAAEHVPIDGVDFDIGVHVANDAYAPRFTAPPMTYISDSLMAWRQETPHDLLDRGRSFQLLTHPETWVGQHRHMGEAMAALVAANHREIDQLFGETAAYYRRLLDERAARDAAFKARHNSST